MLAENFVRQVDTEVGWAVLDCFKGRALLVDKNFLGEARRLELTAQISKIGHAENTRFADGKLCASDMSQDPFSSRVNYFIGSTFRLPTLFGLRGSPAISVYSERRGEYQAFLRTTVVGGEASLTRELRHELPLRLAYSLEFGRTDAQPALLCAVFNRCDSESRALLTERNRPLAVASAHLDRLRTDNPLNPRSGTTLRLDLRGAGQGDRLRRGPPVHQGARRRIVLPAGVARRDVRGAASPGQRARTDVLVQRLGRIRSARRAAVRRRRGERPRIPAERAG